MEKTIELIMNEDRSIQVNNNGNSKCLIREDRRIISAQDIYDILDYNLGDTYKVVEKNEHLIDEQVLIFFKEMFDDICSRINSMDIEKMAIKEDVIVIEQ